MVRKPKEIIGIAGEVDVDETRSPALQWRHLARPPVVPRIPRARVTGSRRRRETPYDIGVRTVRAVGCGCHGFYEMSRKRRWIEH